MVVLQVLKKKSIIQSSAYSYYGYTAHWIITAIFLLGEEPTKELFIGGANYNWSNPNNIYKNEEKINQTFVKTEIYLKYNIPKLELIC